MRGQTTVGSPDDVGLSEVPVTIGEATEGL